jgi:hypothetical protein
MIRSLIMQLSVQRPNRGQALTSLFYSKMRGEQQATADELLATLRQMLEEFDESFIIIDALDECSERDEILTYVEEMGGWHMETLHILVTSRRQGDIESCLDLLVNEHGRLSIEGALVNEDIRTYIRRRLQGDRKFRRWREDLQILQEIESALMNKVDGM